MHSLCAAPRSPLFPHAVLQVFYPRLPHCCIGAEKARLSNSNACIAYTEYDATKEHDSAVVKDTNAQTAKTNAAKSRKCRLRQSQPQTRHSPKATSAMGIAEQ